MWASTTEGQLQHLNRIDVRPKMLEAKQQGAAAKEDAIALTHCTLSPGPLDEIPDNGTQFRVGACPLV
jgi:hypothetical protein